jgi:hypothetical protein
VNARAVVVAGCTAGDAAFGGVATNRRATGDARAIEITRVAAAADARLAGKARDVVVAARDDERRTPRTRAQNAKSERTSRGDEQTAVRHVHWHTTSPFAPRVRRATEDYVTLEAFS